MAAQTDTIVEQISASKALVVVSDRSAGDVTSTFLSEAGFLAQLLACKAGIGSYRRHRREEPGIACGHYRASVARSGHASDVPGKTIKVA
jgi:chaperonin GroEL (HSP60 family)